jgi:hypothetical protein
VNSESLAVLWVKAIQIGSGWLGWTIPGVDF